jgi:16S rRNA (guanine527-N7)-methyltransferase
MSEPGAILVPAPLPDEWREYLARLIASAPLNLVSRGDRSDVRALHVDECAAVAGALTVRAGERWMDLGTGGGLPGLVLASAFPDVQWILLDARSKKLRQVASFVAALGLKNVEVVHGRAEVLADTDQYGGAFDGVVTRAVAPVERTVALSRGFVRRGWIVAIRGPDAPAEAARLVPWGRQLGTETVAVEQVSGTIRSTWLIQLRGLGPPPARFPRARQQLLRPARGGSLDGSR